MKIRSRAACAVAGMVIAAAAYGHHAISLNYDAERTDRIEGEVAEVFWANPHVHYYLTVTGDDGSEAMWDVETGNIIGMTRRGITRDTIQVGDRLIVEGTPGRNGSERMLADSIEQADGTLIMGDDEGESD